MTKEYTPRKRARENKRAEVYGAWLRLKGRGVSLNSAADTLSAIYEVSADTVKSWIRQERIKSGDMKKQPEDVADKHLAAWEKYKALTAEGYAQYEACDAIGEEYGKHWKTILNWINEFRIAKKN